MAYIKDGPKVVWHVSLKEHTEAIYGIREDVRWYTCTERQNRWMFEADLSILTETLNQIYELEWQLIQRICSGN